MNELRHKPDTRPAAERAQSLNRELGGTMHPVLARSFGGLPPRYYVRQFLFGLFFPVPLLLASTHGKGLLALPAHLQVILTLDTPLYPYSRFAPHRPEKTDGPSEALT